MAEVHWSLTASQDLQQIEDFIARDSVPYAVDFVDRLIKSTEKLRQSPQIGRMVPEFGRSDIREVLFKGYRLVYLLKDGVVMVLRVVHGARDLSALAKNEPWVIQE